MASDGARRVLAPVSLSTATVGAFQHTGGRCTKGHALQAAVTQERVTKRLVRNEGASEANRGQIDPAVLRVLAHKTQSFQLDTPGAVVLGPALPGHTKGILRGLLAVHLDD